MFFVYLLRDREGKIYIGYSTNLRRRIEEHKRGKSYWIRRMKGFELIYFEAYKDRNLARKRETNLKKRASSYQGLMKRIGLK